MTDEKPKHKPQKKRTLEEVLKSLQDLIRTDLISPPAARKLGHLTSEPPSGEPASADEPETFQAALHKLNEVITEKIIEPIERAQETPPEPLLPDEELEIEWNDASASTDVQSAIKAIESIELESAAPLAPDEEIEIEALAPDAAPPAQPDIEVEAHAPPASEPPAEVSAVPPESEPSLEPETSAPTEQPALEPVELNVDVTPEAPPAPPSPELSAEVSAIQPESHPGPETEVPAPPETPIAESVEIETTPTLEPPIEVEAQASPTSEPPAEVSAIPPTSEPGFEPEAPVPTEQPILEPVELHVDVEPEAPPAPSTPGLSAAVSATPPEPQPGPEAKAPAPLQTPVSESVEIETTATLEPASEETIDLSETEGPLDVTDNQHAFDFSAPVEPAPPEAGPARHNTGEAQTEIPATIESPDAGSIPATEKTRTAGSVADREKSDKGPITSKEQPGGRAVEPKRIDDAFTVEFTPEPKAPEPTASIAPKTGTDATPPPTREQADTANAVKRPEEPTVKKEPPPTESPDRAPKETAAADRETAENAPVASDSADKTPTAEGDIPVLKDVADLQAPPSPPLPDASQARDIAIRVIAKLNIERRKAGEKPLDIKTIERLQQYLSDALSKRALNKLK